MLVHTVSIGLALLMEDYYVFGTPTMYLLNDKREILLRPSSVNQIIG